MGLFALSTTLQDSREPSRPGASPFISALTVPGYSAIFPRVWPPLRDNLSRSSDGGRGTRVSYTLCLLTNTGGTCGYPAPQAPPVFLPFQVSLPSQAATTLEAATPTERITHYTLQARSCAKRGAAPFGFPHNKQAVCPLSGAYRRLLSAARFTVCM